jgi:hypothetical protein
MPACQAVDSSPAAPSSSSEAISATSPTAEQTRDLEHLLKRPSHLNSVTLDSSGTQSVDLRNGFNSVIMVEKNPDGSHSALCTDSLERANEFLAGTARKPIEYQ